MREFVMNMRENHNVLRQISEFNEMMRRRTQQDLHGSKSEIDSQKNKIFIMEQNKRLYAVRYEVLEEQFTLLFNSIQTISNAKNIEDKFEQELAMMRAAVKTQNTENNELSIQLRSTIAERDYYLKQTNNLIEVKKKMEAERLVQIEAFKKKVNELNNSLLAKTEEAS